MGAIDNMIGRRESQQDRAFSYLMNMFAQMPGDLQGEFQERINESPEAQQFFSHYLGTPDLPRTQFTTEEQNANAAGRPESWTQGGRMYKYQDGQVDMYQPEGYETVQEQQQNFRQQLIEEDEARRRELDIESKMRRAKAIEAALGRMNPNTDQSRVAALQLEAGIARREAMSMQGLDHVLARGDAVIEAKNALADAVGTNPGVTAGEVFSEQDLGWLGDAYGQARKEAGKPWVGKSPGTVKGQDLLGFLTDWNVQDQQQWGMALYPGTYQAKPQASNPFGFLDDSYDPATPTPPPQAPKESAVDKALRSDYEGPTWAGSERQKTSQEKRKKRRQDASKGAKPVRESLDKMGAFSPLQTFGQ